VHMHLSRWASSAWTATLLAGSQGGLSCPNLDAGAKLGQWWAGRVLCYVRAVGQPLRSVPLSRMGWSWSWRHKRCEYCVFCWFDRYLCVNLYWYWWCLLCVCVVLCVIIVCDIVLCGYIDTVQQCCRIGVYRGQKV
jgi:hypothetical protein